MTLEMPSWDASTALRLVLGFGAFDGVYFAAGWPLAVSRSTNLVDWTPVWAPNGSGLTERVTGFVP